MARRRIAAGQLGGIQLTRLANGTRRARARARDDAGELHQLRAVVDTCAAWLAQVRVRAQAGALSSIRCATCNGCRCRRRRPPCSPRRRSRASAS